MKLDFIEWPMQVKIKCSFDQCLDTVAIRSRGGTMPWSNPFKASTMTTDVVGSKNKHGSFGIGLSVVSTREMYVWWCVGAG